MTLALILAGLISLTVKPGVCQAPCDVVIVLKVEPAPDNEKVIVEFREGEGIDSITYTSSDLDYSNGGPKTLQIKYPRIPAGTYEVRASLHKHDGKSWVAGMDKKKIEVRDGLQD